VREYKTLEDAEFNSAWQKCVPTHLYHPVNADDLLFKQMRHRQSCCTSPATF